MTIDCSKIIKYAKICEKLKDDSQPIYDSGLLDFEHETMTFGSQRGFGCIKMPVTDFDGKRKPFFVNLNSLLNVAKEFPVLELDNFTFKHGTDATFEIAHTEDNARFPDFTKGDTVALTLDENALGAIKRCGMFTDVDGVASLNGVFIKQGSVWGTNRNRLCEETVDSLSQMDIALPRIVWETLAMDVLDGNLSISNNGTSFFVSTADIQMQFAINTNLSSPDIHSPAFVEKFNHDSSIVLDKSVLLGVIGFIQPFVATSSVQRIQFIIGDSLEVKSQDNGNIISRKVPILERTGTLQAGSKVWVSANWMRAILGILEGEKVRLQINMDSPAINIATVEKPSSHVVYCRLQEIA